MKFKSLDRSDESGFAQFSYILKPCQEFILPKTRAYHKIKDVVYFHPNHSFETKFGPGYNSFALQSPVNVQKSEGNNNKNSYKVKSAMQNRQEFWRTTSRIGRFINKMCTYCTAHSLCKYK